VIHASAEPKCKEVSHIVFRNFLVLLKNSNLDTFLIGIFTKQEYS